MIDRLGGEVAAAHLAAVAGVVLGSRRKRCEMNSQNSIKSKRRAANAADLKDAPFVLLQLAREFYQIGERKPESREQAPDRPND